MNSKLEKDRILAIARYLHNEDPKAIYNSLGYGKWWFFKWLKRYNTGNKDDWFKDISRQPKTSPLKISNEMEQAICNKRIELDGNDMFCGAESILWELEDKVNIPLPSLSTVKRVLRKHNLIEEHNKKYISKGRIYPKLPAVFPNDVQQFDFVGPCFLKGPVRFYNLNGIDIVSRRCAIKPLVSRGNAFLTIWDSWQRLGIPKFAQFDNGLEFRGSNQYPRGTGQVIRLCLSYGVEAVFIPYNEPWRNSYVEKFNDSWRKKFLSRKNMNSFEELSNESFKFESRHNDFWRYSGLKGKTPSYNLKCSGRELRFPYGFPPVKFGLPESGKYHLMRFIRDDLKLDVFGEKFSVPEELKYEYLKATVDVGKQKLNVYRDKEKVVEFDYKMR